MIPMKKEAYIALALAALTIILVVNGLTSHGWYDEVRSEKMLGNVTSSTIGYGLLTVHNVTKVTFNGTLISKSDEYQSYDDFIASNATRARDAGSRMYLVSIVGLVLTALFIPLLFLAHQGFFDNRMGRLGPYVPLLVAQVAALVIIIGTLWFSYAFPTGLDADAVQLHQERYQALGGRTGLWVLVGGILVQAAAVMALARTQLIYIEPLDTVKGTKPLG